MNCLVTGAAGFVGSHLCERLIADGHEVLGIDDCSVGRISNLDDVQVQTSPRFGFEYKDVVLSTLDFTGVDWVFHLAAKADIVPSVTDPAPYHLTNVGGTYNVLEAARKAGVKRFIYAASSSCYGIPDEYPTKETAEIRPQYPYALTKWIGETYVQHWNKVYGLPTVSLRLFNVYGPQARTNGTYGAVFGVFLAQLYHKKPLTVVGDGSQTRDFTFVYDVVEAFVKAAESEITGEIMNVGSGFPHSINDILAAWNIPQDKVERLPKRPGEPDCTFADISKIQRLLKWHPRVPFKEGVIVMSNFVNQFKDAPLWDRESIAKATEDWFKYLK